MSRGAVKASLFAIGLALVALAGVNIAPRAIDAFEWLVAQDDPVELSSRALKRDLAAERIANELKAALADDDVDLAASFIALAGMENIEIPAALRVDYAAATATGATLRRHAREFFQGAASGEGASAAGIAGVVVSDLTGVGDAREFLREGGKLTRGEEPDRLTLGLAAAGLAVTGATIASIGASLPVRAGVSTLKAAAKSGRLSKPLAAQIALLAGDAIDTAALRAAVSAAARFEFGAAEAAASQALRPAAIAGLRDMAGNVADIAGKAGVRGAHDALAIANDGAELKSVARLAAARGSSTRAVLKTLGRGAIVLTAGALTLAGWVAAGIGWLWLAIVLTLAIVKRGVRPCARAFVGTARLVVKQFRKREAARGVALPV